MIQPQLSASGRKYRRDAGIPLDAPLVGDGRGGNYQIDKATALKIWREIKRLTKLHPPKTVPISQMVADKYKVSKSVVQNIRNGGSWNCVTGLPRKIYD